MDKNILLDILETAKKGNNLGEKITVVGATKMVDVDTINNAISLGLPIVAENKVQEFREKTNLISKIARQHFIGHLQTNKVKYLVDNVDLIQSVDSIHLGQAINDCANKKNIIQDILLEINIGGELSKSGFNPDNIFDNIKTIKDMPNIHVKGLMAMLPHLDDLQLLSALCQKMRRIFDTLKTDGYDMNYLSMGMSGDYKIAIQNGSNMIRIGSLIFGKRVYNEIKEK